MVVPAELGYLVYVHIAFHLSLNFCREIVLEEARVFFYRLIYVAPTPPSPPVLQSVYSAILNSL
jgi:hypothetical protein